MKLVFLFGAQAVGKMTVGQELEKITDLKLFHNHEIIEPVLKLFDEFKIEFIKDVRDLYFKEFASSNQYGMIYTFAYAFDCEEHKQYLNHIKRIFKKYNTEFYFVELVAPREVRLKRNTTPNRLKNKASKNDKKLSKNLIYELENQYRYISLPNEIKEKNYIKIDNTKLSANKVAKMIKEKFSL